MRILFSFLHSSFLLVNTNIREKDLLPYTTLIAFQFKFATIQIELQCFYDLIIVLLHRKGIVFSLQKDCFYLLPILSSYYK